MLHLFVSFCDDWRDTRDSGAESVGYIGEVVEEEKEEEADVT